MEDNMSYIKEPETMPQNHVETPVIKVRKYIHKKNKSGSLMSGKCISTKRKGKPTVRTPNFTIKDYIAEIRQAAYDDILDGPIFELKLHDIGILLRNHSTFRLTQMFLEALEKHQMSKRITTRRLSEVVKADIAETVEIMEVAEIVEVEVDTIKKKEEPEPDAVPVPITLLDEVTLIQSATPAEEPKRSRTGRILMKPKRITSPEIGNKRQYTYSCRNEVTEVYNTGNSKESYRTNKKYGETDSSWPEYAVVESVLPKEVTDCTSKVIQYTPFHKANMEQSTKETIVKRPVGRPPKLKRRTTVLSETGKTKGSKSSQVTEEPTIETQEIAIHHSSRVSQYKRMSKATDTVCRNDMLVLNPNDDGIGFIEIEVPSEPSMEERIRIDSGFKRPKDPDALEIGLLLGCNDNNNTSGEEPESSSGNTIGKPIEPDFSIEDNAPMTVSSGLTVQESPLIPMPRHPPTYRRVVPLAGPCVKIAVTDVVMASIPERRQEIANEHVPKDNKFPPYLLFDSGPPLVVGRLYIAAVEGHPTRMVRYNGVSFDPFDIPMLAALVNDSKENDANALQMNS